MRAQRHVLAAALRVAAEQYSADALVHGRGLSSEQLMPAEARQRLVQCFEDQAALARRLADEVEQADTITLED